MGWWKINAKFSSFLLRRSRRKEIDVFRFFPSSLSRACHIPELYDRGLGLCENIKLVRDRISTTYTNRHQHWSRSFVPCVEDVSLPLPPRGHEFLSPIYTRFITSPAFASNAGTTVLFTCHQWRKYSRFVRLKYVLDTGSVHCFVIAIFARRNA